MHKIIVYPSPTPTATNLAFRHPAYGGNVQQAWGMSDEEFCQYVINHDVTEASRPSTQLVDEADWPTDHTFVDA